LTGISCTQKQIGPCVQGPAYPFYAATFDIVNEHFTSFHFNRLHTPTPITMFNPTVLWSAPEVNPINKKAKSIPAFNLVNVYGRVFFFSWWGFMVAFMSWYAFPPLLTKTIKKDLHLSQKEVANSNIVALTATLLVRAVSGPLCDRFGPRKVFAGCLLAGAIPTAMAGLVTNATGLIVLRFFIGILGASFVPCQVWSTGFFDKNIVGTANALTGGLGKQPPLPSQSQINRY
jgi:MFS transporter, NNP family, nitrate/nitrite transporter